MSSTYLALCQKFRQEVGVSGTGPAAVTSQTGMYAKIVEWIADADEDICSQYLDWGFLWTQWETSTIIGTKDYSAPSDFGMWDEESFYLDSTSSTYRQLKIMDYWYWRENHRNGTKTNDKPSFVVIRPDKAIIIESPPDAVYTLTADYYKTETRMTVNTDTSPIPSKFDRIIIARAKIYYAEHEDAPEVMNGAVNEYRDLMNRLESLYLPGQQARTMGHDDLYVRVE
jgi:hypothetical protein